MKVEELKKKLEEEGFVVEEEDDRGYIELELKLEDGEATVVLQK